MIRLHHFTSLANWQHIRKAGFLACASNPHVSTRRTGAPVVWLTTRDTPEGQGLDPAEVQQLLRDVEQFDKRRVRITVELPRTYTHKWVDWAPRNGGDPTWVAHVRSKVEHAGSWRVHTRNIPRQAWLAAVDLDTGATLSIAPTLAQLGFKPLHGASRR